MDKAKEIVYEEIDKAIETYKRLIEDTTDPMWISLHIAKINLLKTLKTDIERRFLDE